MGEETPPFYVMRTMIQDNWHPDPESLREIALQQEFITRQTDPLNKNYEGTRTRCVSEWDQELYKELTQQMLYSYYGQMNEVEGEMFFHVNTAKEMEEPIYKDPARRIHLDDKCIMTSILYLSPYPPQDTGTELYIGDQKEVVINRYNRLLCFSSGQVPHAAQEYFGKNIYDGRMTLLFFLKNIY